MSPKKRSGRGPARRPQQQRAVRPADGGGAPAAGEAVVAPPVAAEPVADARVADGPPMAVEPVAVEPVAVEPVAVEPVAVEPVAVEPVAVEPVAVEPVAATPTADAVGRPDPEPDTDPDPDPEPPAVRDAPPAPVLTRAGLLSALRPRLRRVDLAVAALLGLLGFAVAVQVRSTQEDGLLTSARQEDLVRILDDLSNRSDRLRQEIGGLTAAQERLTSGTDRDRAALDEARRRAQVLGILAGTVPAEGPGIVLTLNDPTGEVGADDLLDALEELRDAGAEAVQVEGSPGGPVRVVASTSFLEREGGVEVDGVLLRQPYTYTVVGEPATLAAAVAIPGGVTDSVEQQGGSVRVERPDRVEVGALRPLDRPRYARPAPGS